MKRKSLSLLLTFAMVLLLMPVAPVKAASAATLDSGEGPLLPSGCDSSSQLTSNESALLSRYNQDANIGYGATRCPMDIYKVTKSGRLLYVVPNSYTGVVNLLPNSNYVVHLNTKDMFSEDDEIDGSLTINYVADSNYYNYSYNSYSGFIEVVYENYLTDSQFFWMAELASVSNISVAPVTKKVPMIKGRKSIDENGYDFVITTSAKKWQNKSYTITSKNVHLDAFTCPLWPYSYYY